MIFPRPLLQTCNKSNMQKLHITIEGKYHAIKKMVKSLVKQGWEVVDITGEPTFRFTTVVLEK